jgi:hypothetical protein
MSHMYSPLNEDFLLQDMRNRREALIRPLRDDAAARAGRRWWRRSAHRAG